MKPPIKTLWWKGKSLFLIDQRKLPEKEEIIEIKNVKEVWKAIKELKVRGAPAIGCTGAYGVVISSLNIKTKDYKKFIEKLKKDIEYLKTSRPTAYNLFFALERMEKLIENFKEKNIEKLKREILKEAEKIYLEDLESCYKIGLYGSALIKENMNILTHCNAGGLATTGYGTALSVFFVAKEKGKNFHVFVDETRPVLQGARLTAWELEKTKIPYTLICDNMAGYLMSQGKIDMVIVGADRIALNGDTANKIGTYSLAVLAKYHKVDFYVAAPFSTFDPFIKTGKEIPVEERNPDEIRKIKGKYISPKNAHVYNPAFDITPGKLIKGIITEKGIITPPYSTNIKKFLSQ